MPQRVVQEELDPFKLTQGERMSGTWQRLSKELEKMRESLRRRNDDNLGEADTARLRGRIAQINDILRYGEDDQQVEFNQDEEFVGGLVPGRARR